MTSVHRAIKFDGYLLLLAFSCHVEAITLGKPQPVLRSRLRCREGLVTSHKERRDRPTLGVASFTRPPQPPLVQLRQRLLGVLACELVTPLSEGSVEKMIKRSHLTQLDQLGDQPLRCGVKERRCAVTCRCKAPTQLD
eukprot:scaffold259835_cov36-Tisochrysis_lutea.AAC.2